MSTKRVIFAIAATALISAAVTVFAYRRNQEDDARDAGGRAGALQSTVLGERREYSVHLPAGYDKDATTRYPVLYVLDGESQAAHTAESASLLARIGAVPPIIVVGITNVDEETRARDYTPPGRWRATEAGTSPAGGALRMLSFLETELIGHIEGEYRTARPRMLAGWSRSGSFALYSQIVAPSVFDGRFAHSPFVWSDEDEATVTRFEEGLGTFAGGASFLYLSLGEEEVQTAPAFQRAVRALESGAPPTLRWRADSSAAGDHNSNAHLSAPVALCAMFAPDSGQPCRPAPG